MSFSKRILFDNLPEDDQIRAELTQLAQTALEAFSVRALPRPRRPKRNLAGKTRDPFWKSALDTAIIELGIDQRIVNEVPRFRTLEDRDRVHEVAVNKWNFRWQEHERMLAASVRPVQVSSRTSNESHPNSSAPFILGEIPPDPCPSDDDLKPYLTDSSGSPEVDQLTAKADWRHALIEKDENAFLVPYVSWVTPPINYDAFRRTRGYRNASDKVLAKAGYKCACCPSDATEVHHRDYRPRVLSGRDLSPLVPVCRPCHNLIERERAGSWQMGEAKLAELVRAENERLATANQYEFESRP